MNPAIRGQRMTGGDCQTLVRMPRCAAFRAGLSVMTKDVKMLLGLPPILGPDLLFTLRSMGHGDEIALVDGNYPAQDHARRLLRADGHGILALFAAILSVLPLDADVEHPVCRAALNNDPSQMGSIHIDIDRAYVARYPGRGTHPLSGAELYPRIRAAHTIVATSEMELFGNIILRKGVITAGQV
jgi:L-fucose mutarotase